MRPKKIILCVDPDEIALSIVTYMLETNGYRTIKATCLADALTALTEFPVELVFLSAKKDPAATVFMSRTLKKHYPAIPVLLLCNTTEIVKELHLADALVSEKWCSSADLLERIKILSARKRGPKRGSHRVPFPAANGVNLPAAVGPAA